MAIVYKATNRNNGKFYFGQTNRTLKQRKAAHASSAKQGSQLRFHQAIRKYGIDAFLFEEIYFGDIDIVRKIEEQYIAEFSSMDFSIGYNSTKGGCGGWIVPKEKYDSWLLKMTASVQGNKNGRWSGYTDDELVSIACNKLKEENYTYVPSFNVIKTLIPDFPHVIKGNYRFNGLGWKQCQETISERLGLKIINHYRSDELKNSLREKNSNKVWYTDGKKDIQIKLGLLPPDGFIKGRTFNRGKHVKN